MHVMPSPRWGRWRDKLGGKNKNEDHKERG